MAKEDERQPVDDALGHAMRVDLVRLLWHRGEPATATELQRDLHDPATLGDANYHLLVLERDGVIELAPQSPQRVESGTQRAYVIGGDNADDATRRLGLWS